MCTVSFVPGNGRVFLTSNRDEKTTRPLALAPAISIVNGKKMLYPIDPQSGGTWIGVSDDKQAGVLLNGAFFTHTAMEHYRMSRGQVFLEILSHDEPPELLHTIALDNIEPFTFILLSHGTLSELRWDGIQKHFKKLDQSKPHIWSSATLYDMSGRTEREQWFKEFLHLVEEPTASDILHFHRTAGSGNPAASLIMQRGMALATASITQLTLGDSEAKMYYQDLRSNTGKETVLHFAKLS